MQFVSFALSLQPSLKAATPDDFSVLVALLPPVSVLMKFKYISVKDISPFHPIGRQVRKVESN
jgi:hypothetical protein